MAPDPSPTPEELAARALDPAAPAATRDAALAGLDQLFRQVADQAARQLNAHTQVRKDLLDQGPSHAYERLPHYDPAQGPLPAWLFAVLYNHGLDLRRRWSRYHGRHTHGPNFDLRPGPAMLPSGGEANARLAACFARMRHELDRVAWPAPRGVDYYAVLLVSLRVEMAARYRREGAATVPGHVAGAVADWLPWHSHEESRAFRGGLPPLARLWPRLAPRLEGNFTLYGLLDLLNEPPPDGGPVVYSTLAQWCYRARHQARTRLGLEAWEQGGFARLLSGPPAGRGPAGGGD